ncbi:helicase HerA-like domain-containing protein [Flavihumibacter sp. CACIAM 22H1]|uniref:helicase HerA-like domain-containing protein n=1 Tax=Flavihumibacter sp. CACIAM 22H1 TaxID=1812911 RepID=UPI0007A84D6F|nr:helicase HerA-like domain-containing protein [Flavihumibacter sp. CACIAM 22H1]KYP16437.1 MAG: ATPase [Flavihumibacter sp. CACIAM 22H1]
MPDTNQFIETIRNGYSFKGDSAKIGVGILDGVPVPDAEILVPLKTLNRHGLIAGATGTGKTKTLQILAEVLSDNSVPVLLMDIKGDLSGIAAAGAVNEKIKERYQHLRMEYQPSAYPAELLSLSGEPGVRLRATVSEFGPVLLSKILGLNDTQAGLVAMIFKWCDDNQLPLLDLKDFIKVLQYVSDEGKNELEKAYGKISTTSTGTILRKVVELQQQGADTFFGEKSFEVDDLMRISDDGRGIVSILRVTDLQDRPKLFSTFMLQLLAELYGSCPEEGDLDKPKLVLFVDEAHLIFQEASPALLQQIETIVKLIRSKGIGIFFCTQNPMDVPKDVLGQLGLKIQHALRAFTAADRKVIKQTAENYPETSFYKTDELLTQLGIGEAMVTLLNEKGIPTPLAHVLLISPRSRMDILTEQEIGDLVSASKLVKKYNQAIDSESAYELLTAKLEEAAGLEAAEEAKKQAEKEANKSNGSRPKEEKSVFEKMLNSSAGRQATRTLTSTITRTLLGALGLGGRSSKKKSLW